MPTLSRRASGSWLFPLLMLLILLAGGVSATSGRGAQGVCPQCKRYYSSARCPIHGIRLGAKPTPKPATPKPRPRTTPRPRPRATPRPKATPTPTPKPTPKPVIIIKPTSPPKVTYDAKQTNTIKASLKAARMEQTPETQLKVEQNITIALSRNGDPNVREDEEGETALFWAIRERRGNVVALLLELGADVTVKDTTGETALHEAANADADTARKLIERGADVNAASKDGTTPLIATVKVGNNEVTELLLVVEGIKAGAADEEGWTALHYAAQRGDVEAVKLLIAKKVDVNAQSKSGDTPLKLAGSKGHTEVEQALTAAGARP